MKSNSVFYRRIGCSCPQACQRLKNLFQQPNIRRLGNFWTRFAFKNSLTHIPARQATSARKAAQEALEAENMAEGRF
ncbi:hypothetical protein [Mesorhizobium koreense]|jgi:hypothetical protein|uniref:hypothetical protein n=1 Tax=Mesorhizobium koreense TaxID=3074855 RepID=UPI00287B8B7D|nr:hypothetical protein [Mesorhizobium sp. WR6]